MFLKRNLPALAALGLILGCAHVQKTPPSSEAPPILTATLTPTAAPSAVKTTTLAFVGDIMMGGSAAYKLKTEGPDSFFTRTTDLLKLADVVTGNLEGPLGLTGKKTPNKKYTFLVDPSAATGLAHAGFSLLTLANNHTMDFGVEALQSTIEALENNGLKHAGAGFNEAQARQPAWLDVKGRKVAVLAYSLTYPTSYWANAKRAGCASADGYHMKEDIQAARAAGAGLVFVCCHWGKEKHTKLEWYQTTLAHLAIEAGADGVICHHPHIWQALEVYQGKPIAYSIGNFAFGSFSTSTTQSGILYLTFDEKGQWLGGKVIPLNVNNYRVRFCPEPMKEPASKKFWEYLQKLSLKKVVTKVKGKKKVKWIHKVDLTWDGSQITWVAPAPVTEAIAPTATPTPISTPSSIETPTSNTVGSVPGASDQ
jgi:poly-gamma-glutamate synthesis protein (capsule biosynthesis protein)